MTEPILNYEDPAGDTAWYDWLQAKDDEQLRGYWDYVRNWAPAQDPQADPDAMQLKYELAGQEMDRRGL
jgi:hypothetical protein